MTEKQMDDVYYVCSLIEYTARKTQNHRQDIVQHFTKADMERQLRLAEVNHCLSFEQVSDELIEDYTFRMAPSTQLRNAVTRYLLSHLSAGCIRGWCCLR